MPDISYPGVYIEELPANVHVISRVATADAIFIGYTAQTADPGTPQQVNSYSAFARQFGGDDAPPDGAYLAPALWQFFRNGGMSAFVLSIGRDTDPVEAQQIEAALTELESFEYGTLLLCPDAARLGPQDRAQVGKAMLAHCAKLRRRFAILDVVGPLDQGAIADFRAQIGTENLDWGAAYTPMTSVRFAGTTLEVPPSGAVAAIYARTDAQKGVWKAPAGVDALVQGAFGLATEISDQDQAQLLGSDAKAINPVRNINSEGPVIWGAQTLAPGLDFKYVPVRRLAIFIEQSLANSLQWAVFEPNDEPLWRSVKTAINAFLTSLWRDGALVGATPEQAFDVRVGLGESMTQHDIELGRMVINIGFAPMYPAEFVIIQIEQMTREPD